MNTTTNPYQGDQAAGMFTGSNGNNDDWLISPTITVAAGQRLRYQYRVYDSFFVEDLEVKLSVNGVELDQFTTMLYTTDTDPVDLNNMNFKEKVINLPAGITGDINIAWHIPQKTPSPAGYLGQILVIDNVIIENIPACPSPSNLAVSNVNDVQAQILWDSNGTEAEWEVYVQPEGLPAPVGAGDAQYNHTATASPYTVTGLTPAIAYQYYVRAVCSDSQQSEWVGPFDFTTMCSFENLCEYTITLSNDTTFGVGGSIDLIQNGVTLNQMEFWSGAWDATPESIDYTVFLCTGVEFSLFWNAVGTAPDQYPGAQVTIINDQGVVVWTSEMGLGTPRTTMYTGVSLCGPITCPQPTNLAVNATGDLSWTAGGTETQWEVAIQPAANNTLPQAGTLVSTTSYTPSDSDFSMLTAGTYEFFVRAICGTNDKSFWSGPHQFVKNDDASTAIILPVNDGETCEQSASSVSFIGATASADATTCTGVNNGDIWFEFTAVEKVHLIELSNFSGSYYYAAGGIPQPKITMSLYKVNGTALEQMACTYNNMILAAYSTELEVGATYKVRLTLTSDAPNDHTFDVCVTTPQDPCNMTSLNYGFEKPYAATGALTNFYTQQVVPGWRTNLSTWDEFFYVDALNAMNIIPYQGGQLIQLLADDGVDDPTDLVNIKGTYQDFDTSEITKFNYNYAQSTRSVSEDNVIQLFAGPPSGPFALVEENAGTLSWVVQTGSYNVPEGQTTTRFIFRAKNGSIGNVLDAVNFIADNTIITQPVTLECSEDLVTLEANGKGTWIADENNPSVALIATPNSSTTEITGFTHSGAYTFRWKTRYCENTIVITSQSINEVPAVTSPVTYCAGDVAVALTATPNDNYSLVWYNQAQGGTASTTAPVPSTVTAGTTPYYVAYANAEGCEGQRAQIQVVVNAGGDAVTGFAYDEQQYCTAATNPVITLNPGFTTGGTFTVTPTAGLSIDTATGAIDLSTSTEGVYEVTYSVVAAQCVKGGSSATTITILGDLTPVITEDCKENELWLHAAAVNGSFDGSDVTYIWKTDSGATVGSDNPDFNVSEYYAANAGLQLPFGITVTVASGTCSGEAGYTVLSTACMIPRGISPNWDGDNDSFDLANLNIKEISIFNRYGLEVFHYNSGYTNQWHGQDKNNHDLPDGTYFYSIHKADGSAVTGWVYINREY
jgi:gliding motility-associated-like protein